MTTCVIRTLIIYFLLILSLRAEDCRRIAVERGGAAWG